MMKFVDDFRRQATGDKVFCLNCGSANATGLSACENCENELITPAPFFVNLAETFIRPMRAMPRIAATAPLMQAFLVVVLGILAALLLRSVGLLQLWESLLANLDTISQQNREAIQKITQPPIPGLIEFTILPLLYLISWFFYASALYYTARLLYRNDARANFFSLLAVAGFARVATLANLLLLLIPNLAIGGTSVPGILSLVILLWQVGLVFIGVKFSTGLSWNRASIVVLLPTLLLVFLLNFPI